MRAPTAHRTSRRDVLVLCYHGVSPLPVHGEVPLGVFRRQLEHVRRQRYTWSTCTDAIFGSGEKVAAVTFDDGVSSVLEFAAPVLAALGAPATVFPRLDELGQPGRMDVAGLLDLSERGWEVGSHTLTHPDLTTIDDVSLGRELRESRLEIERITGRQCPAVAYPLGRADARVVAAAETAGYVVGAALQAGTSLPSQPLAWPRVGIRGDDGMLVFRVKCSRAARAVRASRARGIARPVAHQAGRLRRAVVGRSTRADE